MKISDYTDTAARYARRLWNAARALLERYVPVVRNWIWQKTYRFTRIALYGTGIYINNRAARSAAQFSFFILMTLFPLIICVHWIIVMLNENSSDLLKAVGQLFPPSVNDFFTGYLADVADTNDKKVLVAGLIMLVTPSAAAFRSLRGILCDIRRRREPNGALMFILSFFISIIMLLIIYVSMALLFTGRRLLQFLIDRFHLSRIILDFDWMRFLLLYVILAFWLYLMYRFAHINLMDPREVFKGYAYPGALLAPLIIVAVSILFSSWIFSISERYSAVYGSLAAVIILMTWLYTCSSIIIAGGIFNRIIDERKALARRFKPPKDIHAVASTAKRTLRSAMNKVSSASSSDMKKDKE